MEVVLALDPSDDIFIIGGTLMGVGGILAFPFGAIWGIPVMGMGIVAKGIEEVLETLGIGDDEPQREPLPCGAVIAGLPETTSATSTWYHSLAQREETIITETLILEPVSTLPPCPSGSSPVHMKERQPYPKSHDKRDQDKTFTQALMACNSTNLRGKDVKRLRETTMHITAADQVMLKGSDFEVRGNVSWTKSNTTSGLIKGEHSFFVPGIDTLVEGVVVAMDETAADQPTNDAFNLLMMAVNKSHRQSDLVEAIKDLAAVLR